MKIEDSEEWTFEKLEEAWKEIQAVANDFGLDYYPAQFEIISAEQMLDNYSSHGLPFMYPHWSFGKSFIQNEKDYKDGKMGLAYEIVINSNPSIAYLMESNSLVMQTLVMAHASVGHSHVFKNNYMFKDWTSAESIIPYLKFARNYIANCEEKEGIYNVEVVLDACHALQNFGVDKYKRPPKLKAELMVRKQRLRREAEDENFNDMWRTLPKPDFWEEMDKILDGYLAEYSHSNYERTFPEENILYFLEKKSDKLEGWQKEIIRIVRKIAQYFYPQMQCKLLHEAAATFVHYEIMVELYNRGKLTEGAYLEFIQSHCGVVYQHPYSQPNVYALGFAMFSDIKRMVLDPTEEDLELFPDIAGTGDYWAVFKDIVANYRDDSFIQQFLSPNVVKHFKYFTLKDNEGEDEYQVSQVHDLEDFETLRENLSKQYSLQSRMPQIEIQECDWEDTRTLYLIHRVYNGQILDYNEAKKTLEYLKFLWGHDIEIAYLDEKGIPVERVE